MPTSYQEWNFRGNRLTDDVNGKDFVTSESTLLLVSPQPTYESGVLSSAQAVGLTQDASFNQRRQVVQVNEVGSNQKYTISSSRTDDSLNLSRALFDGRSLMKVLAPQYDGEDEFRRRDQPGYGEFFSNLGSSLFSKPIGLMMIFRDLENQNVGGVFFERAFLVSHNMQVSANSPFLGEGINIMFDQLLPLRPTTGSGS